MFVARDDGESGRAERRSSEWHAAQYTLPQLAWKVCLFHLRDNKHSQIISLHSYFWRKAQIQQKLTALFVSLRENSEPGKQGKQQQPGDGWNKPSSYTREFRTRMRPLRQVCSYLKTGQSGASVQGHNVLCNPHITYTAKDTEQARVDTHKCARTHTHTRTFARALTDKRACMNPVMLDW